jgi:hypothetical protein
VCPVQWGTINQQSEAHLACPAFLEGTTTNLNNWIVLVARSITLHLKFIQRHARIVCREHSQTIETLQLRASPVQQAQLVLGVSRVFKECTEEIRTMPKPA